MTRAEVCGVFLVSVCCGGWSISLCWGRFGSGRLVYIAGRADDAGCDLHRFSDNSLFVQCNGAWSRGPSGRWCLLRFHLLRTSGTGSVFSVGGSSRAASASLAFFVL